MACFADAAARLAGLAGAVLGWSPDRFWRATPAELAVVVAVLRGEAAAVDPPDAATRERLQEAFPDGR
ncbi:phage tail assembly chaperone [Sphingomonas sp. PWP1-2]|uniref:phage tail assembly chaperone n=1 Tax=Sphingomonas sp. PWP1-2 TaxID=2804558 RepID=UPI003CF7B44A